MPNSCSVSASRGKSAGAGGAEAQQASGASPVSVGAAPPASEAPVLGVGELGEAGVSGPGPAASGVGVDAQDAAGLVNRCRCCAAAIAWPNGRAPRAPLDLPAPALCARCRDAGCVVMPHCHEEPIPWDGEEW